MDVLAHWMEQHATWMPLIIFLARIVDVSCGTVRTICVVRGLGVIAMCIGFVEVTVWLAAISSVVNQLDRPLNVVGYAAGFASGNYVGMWIESKLALGNQVVRLISRDTTHSLATRLREAGYVVTVLEGHGRDLPVTICFVATMRRMVRPLIKLAKLVDPDVLVTVEDVRETDFKHYHTPPGEGEWADLLKRK